LTANAVSGMKEMFLQNNMNDFLPKPIEMLKLNKTLNKWIPAEKQKKHDEYVQETEAATSAKIEIEGVDVKSGLSLNGGIMSHDHRRSRWLDFGPIRARVPACG
jgi:hypothetical protein